MNKPPKITVISAVFNAESHLNDCILSILGQTYKNIEFIIIDGGSTDKTVDIIRKYQASLSYWISEPDQGIYDAWNKGLAVSSGEWISFVGADDVLLPDAVQNYVDHIENHKKKTELEFVSSRIEIVNKDMSHIKMVGEEWEWKKFRKEMTTWHVGTFHSKLLFKKYGNFDSTYKISGDYELLLRASDKLVTSFIDSSTAKMRIGGISNSNLIEASAETYRAKIKNNAISPLKGKTLSLIDKIRLLFR